MEWVRALALLIAAGAFASAALSLGGAFSDRLDILTHFTPFWLAGGLAGLSLAVLGRSGWPVMALALAAVVIGLALMAPEWLNRAALAPAAVDGHGRLTLVQFNLWTHNADPAATAAWISAQDADIVTVEEADGAGGAVVAALAERYPFRVTSSRASQGAAQILSKVRPTAGGDLLGGKMRRFAGAWARYGEGPGAFTVAAVHYTWPVHDGEQQMQSRRVAAFLDNLTADGSPKARLIVAGDFNSTPWSFALRRQDARFGLTRLTRGLFTWPTPRFRRMGLYSPLPLLPIDHVYAGSAWRAASVRAGPVLGSDHRPVVVVLEPSA